MKRVLVIILLFFLYGCIATNKKPIKITKIANSPNLIKVRIENNISEKSRLPLIDDFERSNNNWELSTTGKSSAFFNILPNKSGNKVGYLNYKIEYSNEEYSPNVVNLIYSRKMNFKPYRGICFTAKGDSRFIYKIKIFEIENYFGENKKEVWYKTFKVTPEFKLYKINFDEMIVEEFFEQDYVSDNIQTFTNISGIGFTVQNGFSPDINQGELYIDNISLF